MISSELGERAEAAVINALVRAGKLVYLPLGSRGRTDLVFEDAGGLARLQCKTASVTDGVLRFWTCSNTGGERKDYRGDVEFFGVYCHERNEVYLVPVEDVPLRLASLRLTMQTRSGQRQGIRWAAPYLLAESVAPRLFQPDELLVEPETG